MLTSIISAIYLPVWTTGVTRLSNVANKFTDTLDLLGDSVSRFKSNVYLADLFDGPNRWNYTSEGPNNLQQIDEYCKFFDT